MSPRVCVVTAGHLATCPRMLKAADALYETGYDVRVVSAKHTPWAGEADRELRQRRAWRWTLVDYDRESAPGTYLRTGIRRRAAQRSVEAIGPLRAPLPLAARAFSRVHAELRRAILAEPADFIYGGTTGALAAIAEAAGRARVPYALDLEDFHSAEQVDTGPGQVANRLAERIERVVLPGAAFLTTSSASIARAYEQKYAVCPITIHNTFPLPPRPPASVPHDGAGLRLCWFSQTIGPHRGLEDAVRAMGIARLAGELHLRGREGGCYLTELRELASDVAPRLAVLHHQPSSPDAMIEVCHGYDVGLALERPEPLNRALCQTNKAFTYLLAGLAIAFSDTPGQRPLAADLGAAALLYKPGDVSTLAAGLKRWADDTQSLTAAKVAAWEAARRRWHWEHQEERGALLRVVKAVLGR